jgi:hypothetical protein
MQNKGSKLFRRSFVTSCRLRVTACDIVVIGCWRIAGPIILSRVCVEEEGDEQYKGYQRKI